MSTLARLARSWSAGDGNGPLARLGSEAVGYRLLFVVAAVATVLPFWAGAVLPLQDYAGNMTYAVVLRGAMEEGSLYARIFETEGLLTPNGLLLWAWAGLGSLVGFLVAGKLLLSLYAVLLPLSLERLLVAFGRSREVALLAFPLAWNNNLMMGFVTFATSLPLILYTVARAWRYRERPSLRGAAEVAVLSVLTFVAHAMGYLILGVAALVLLVMGGRSLRELWRLAWPFALSLSVFLPWVWEQYVAAPRSSALGGRPLEPMFEGPETRLEKWGHYSLLRWTGSFDDWALWGLLVLGAVGVALRRADRLPGTGRDRYVPEALTLTSLACYLLLPEGLVEPKVIASRMVTVTMLFGLCWMEMPRRRLGRGAMLVAMTAVTLVMGVGARRHVEAFNREEVGSGFLSLVAGLPHESRLAFIRRDEGSDHLELQAHSHLYGYHFALNRGISYTFTFHGHYGRHAYWRKGRAPPWPGRRVPQFMRGSASCWYDYLLVRSREPPSWRRRLMQRLTYLGDSGEYSLWKVEQDRIPHCRSQRGGGREGEERDGSEREQAEDPGRSDDDADGERAGPAGSEPSGTDGGRPGSRGEQLRGVREPGRLRLDRDWAERIDRMPEVDPMDRSREAASDER